MFGLSKNFVYKDTESQVTSNLEYFIWSPKKDEWPRNKAMSASGLRQRHFYKLALDKPNEENFIVFLNSFKDSLPEEYQLHIEITKLFCRLEQMSRSTMSTMSRYVCVYTHCCYNSCYYSTHTWDHIVWKGCS